MWVRARVGHVAATSLAWISGLGPEIQAWITTNRDFDRLWNITSCSSEGYSPRGRREGLEKKKGPIWLFARWWKSRIKLEAQLARRINVLQRDASVCSCCRPNIPISLFLHKSSSKIAVIVITLKIKIVVILIIMIFQQNCNHANDQKATIRIL